MFNIIFDSILKIQRIIFDRIMWYENHCDENTIVVIDNNTNLMNAKSKKRQFENEFDDDEIWFEKSKSQYLLRQKWNWKN